MHRVVIQGVALRAPASACANSLVPREVTNDLFLGRKSARADRREQKAQPKQRRHRHRGVPTKGLERAQAETSKRGKTSVACRRHPGSFIFLTFRRSGVPGVPLNKLPIPIDISTKFGRHGCGRRLFRLVSGWFIMGDPIDTRRYGFILTAREGSLLASALTKTGAT